MQIVTDSGADLAPSQLENLPVHIVPLHFSLCGNHYIGGQDISNERFYQMLTETGEYPVTSQAPIGEIAEMYRELAKTDPDILSIHISSGLSGTLNAAKSAAAMVPEAHVTFWDSLTLSAALGWQVQAAGLMINKGWSKEQILERLGKIRDHVDGMFTMKEMRYLIHGGRISHLKGLMAQVLNIKPTIGVSHENGMYTNVGQDMSFKKAISHMVQICQDSFPKTDLLRVQFVHGHCPEGLSMLSKFTLEKLKNFKMEETVSVAPSLGSHVGPSLTGIIVGPMSLFADLL